MVSAIIGTDCIRGFFIEKFVFIAVSVFVV